MAKKTEEALPPVKEQGEAVSFSGIDSVESNAQTLGQDVKNAVGYSGAAGALATLFVFFILRDQTYTATDIATVTASLTVLFNAAIVIVKKVLDRYVA